MEGRPDRLSSTILLARLLSTAGHPFLLIPLTVAAATRSWLWTSVVLASTTLPLTAITLRNVRRGTWSDPDVSSRQERPGLYLAAVPVLAAVAALLWWLDAPPRMMRSVAAAAAMMLAGIASNDMLKISLHMMFSAFCGVTIVHFYPRSIVAVVPFVLAIGWSRWKLGRHTPAEIAVGLALGCLAGLFTNGVV